MSAAAIHSLPCSLNDAARIASLLGIPVRAISLHRFPDEELRVTVGSAAATSIIYATLDRPAEKLLAIMFAAEALRRTGAERLVLVAPYMCYMRQDTAFHDGEAISQKVIGRLLAGTVDRIITVDAHLHRTTDIRDVFPGIEADNLSAIPAIAKSLRAAGLDPRTIVVGPDAESRPWVNDLAERLGRDLRGRAEDTFQRSFGGSRVCRSRIVRRPSRSAGRRYCLDGRYVDCLRESAGDSRGRGG